MPNKNFLLFFVVLFILTGCKIVIVVPSDGSVTTLSQNYTCDSGETCTIDVVDLFFNESFVAQPDSGYTFLQWKKREKGLCGGRAVECALDSSLAEGIDFLVEILESDTTFYLEPEFGLSDSYARKAALSVASVAVSTCVVGDKLYAFGLGHGHEAGARADRVEMYDPSSNTWTRRADMPTARAWATAGAIKGKCYVVGGGGSGDSGSEIAVEEYDPRNDSWRTRRSLPESRVGAASAVVDGRLYVLGGSSIGNWTAGGDPESFAYDPVSNRWSTVADIPTPLNGVAAGVIDGDIYVVGGSETGLNLTDLVQRYNPVNDRWSRRARLPVPLAYPAVSVVGGSLYVFGGLDDADTSAAIANVYRYDPQADDWTRLADMAKTRQSFPGETIGGLIYLIGGRTSRGLNDLVDVDEYTP